MGNKTKATIVKEAVEAVSKAVAGIRGAKDTDATKVAVVEAEDAIAAAEKAFGDVKPDDDQAKVMDEAKSIVAGVKHTLEDTVDQETEAAKAVRRLVATINKPESEFAGMAKRHAAILEAIDVAEKAIQAVGELATFKKSLDAAYAVIRDLRAAMEVPAKVDYHTIAEGHALTSAKAGRGILGPGARVDADDFGEGEKALANFVRIGAVNAPEK